MKVRRSRRIISGLLLLWLGLLQFPLPFAVRAAGTQADGKDLSTPFPCMNRPCGCRSAEECWTSCCCTTKEERIAFVLEHDMGMPAALMTPDDEAEKKPARSCCATQSKSCCESGAAGECTAAEKPAVAEKPSKSSKLVLFTTALKCKGLNSMLMQFAGAVLQIPPMQPEVQPALRVVTDLVDDLLTGVTLSPPAPPPRIAG